MLQQSQINNWEDLFNRLNIFITECNGEQIRYASNSFAELCHLFADQLIKEKTPLVGISPLLKAISKLQMNEKCLTSVHADVAKLALASKCFTSPVLQLLETNYNEISKEATVNTKNLLLFFYYGGMITASVKVSKFLRKNEKYSTWLLVHKSNHTVKITETQCGKVVKNAIFTEKSTFFPSNQHLY